MFKKSLAMSLLALFIPRFTAPSVSSDVEDKFGNEIIKGKGQLRAAKPKPSGAAQLKRAAKKRSNIRKH